MSKQLEERLRADFNEILFNAGVRFPDPTNPDLWPEMVNDLIDAAIARADQHIYELRRTL